MQLILGNIDRPWFSEVVSRMQLCLARNSAKRMKISCVTSFSMLCKLNK
jgi:hypothetical protein